MMANLAAVQRPMGAKRVIESDDARWSRLHALIEAHSLKRGDFILSSGRRSKYLFQLRQTTMAPEGAAILGDVIIDYMNAQSIGCVGGLAVGAVPLVAAASAISFIKKTPKDTFFVRKEPKGHGARERIDGHLQPDAEALIVDDVATSGGSILKAIEGMHTEYPSCIVRKALVVVDREEGAFESLARQGIELVSIFKRSDFRID